MKYRVIAAIAFLLLGVFASGFVLGACEIARQALEHGVAEFGDNGFEWKTLPRVRVK